VNHRNSCRFFNISKSIISAISFQAVFSIEFDYIACGRTQDSIKNGEKNLGGRQALTTEFNQGTSIDDGFNQRI
jgi:hypothetical protein